MPCWHSGVLLWSSFWKLTKLYQIRYTTGAEKMLHVIGQIGNGKNAERHHRYRPDAVLVRRRRADFECILKAVVAKYVYVLSATPVRKDGHHPIIFMQCDSVRYLVDEKGLAEKQAFTHCVIPRFTSTYHTTAASIQDIYTEIIENEQRNELILSDTLHLIHEGRTPLLLTERKNHAMLLRQTVVRTGTAYLSARRQRQIKGQSRNIERTARSPCR